MRYRSVDPNDLGYKTCAWKDFKFPACKDCNDYHADLERKASKVVKALLNREGLGQKDMIVLLDWLDKIRSASYIGFIQTMGAEAEFSPLYVVQHVASQDRVAYVTHYTHMDGLVTPGISSVFLLMPAAIGIAINDMLIMSVGFQGLLSKSFGFPYMSGLSMSGHHQASGKISAGSGAISSPIVSLPYQLPSLKILQPIIPDNILCDREDLIAVDHVQSHILSDGKSGRVFVEGVNGLSCGRLQPDQYPARMGDGVNFQKFARGIFLVQNYLLETMEPRPEVGEHFSTEHAKEIMDDRAVALRENNIRIREMQSIIDDFSSRSRLFL